MQQRDDDQRFLEQAEEDLRWAQHLAEAGGYYLACFLAQQVAEKALKALLYHFGEELVMGHSVERLCQRANTYVPELKDRCEEWKYLDNFYVPTRYPNALPGTIPARVYGERAGRDAVAAAGDVVETVRTKMGG